MEMTMAHRASVSPVRLVSGCLDELVSDLVSLFEAKFAAMPWVERYRLLEQVHDYLEENSQDRESVAPAFARIVEQLVMRVGSPQLSCSEQAHIYAASRALVHRRQARVWFARTSRGSDEKQSFRPSLRSARPA